MPALFLVRQRLSSQAVVKLRPEYRLAFGLDNDAYSKSMRVRNRTF